jgi:glycosyltransferase involved in cell wall biosynthesis
MINGPTFSVIIPTYHRNDLLAKCLDCLAPGVQTLASEQYEVIVTDDGRETTAEQMILDRYPWVKWVAGSSKGPAANRNNGASYAQGEWLVFTDDDCLPDAQWLEAYAGAIVNDVYVYEGKTTCKAGLKSPLEHAPINLTGGCLWSCNMMLQVGLFHRVGSFNENFPYPHMEDVELRERLSSLKNNFHFVAKAIVDHPPRRLSQGNILGVSHESYVYYSYHIKHVVPSKSQLLKELLRNRLTQIIRYSLHKDLIEAFISLILEVSQVLINWDCWVEKHVI